MALRLVEDAAREESPFNVVMVDGTLRDMARMPWPRRCASAWRTAPPVLMILTGIAETNRPGQMATRGFDGQIARPVRQSQLFDTIMDAVARASSSAIVRAPQDDFEAVPVNALNGVRILVVEDNEVNQMVATEILGGAGYICECAPNGRKAVEAVTAIALRPGADGLPDAGDGRIRSDSHDPPA